MEKKLITDIAVSIESYVNALQIYEGIALIGINMVL